jgi:O-antigen ligase
MSHPGGLALARASLVLIGLAWVVPFLQPYHRYPLTAFYGEWLAFAFGLAAALALLRKEAWRNAELPVIALGLVGFMLLLALQVALGRVPYPEQALTAGLYLSWAVLLLMLARALRAELGMATIAVTLAWFALAGGILAALVGFLQHYQFSVVPDFLVMQKGNGPVYGNLGQPNHYAAYLTLALASAVYLHGRGRLHGALAAPCIALLALMLALSGSRSPFVYLVVLTLLAATLYWRRPDAQTRKVAVLALWLVPAFALAQWVSALPLLQPAQGAPLTSLQRLFESASGIQPRLQLAGEAWQMFRESPLLGAGFGQFSWHHFAWGPPVSTAATSGVIHHAHNIVLQLMAETGLAGSLLIVGASLYWLAGWWRAITDLEWWWVGALLAVIGIHSLLEYPLWYSYFLGIASILLGLGATRVLTIRMTRIGRAVTALALAVGWLNAIAIITPYRDFERLVFEARPEERPGEAPVGERAYGEAVMQIHREPLLKPYVELAISFGIVVSESDLRDKLDLNGRVMRFAPIDPVVYRQALLLAMNREHEAALRQLELAARAYPQRLDEALVELRLLERRHPGRFAPLLELAAARSAELRAQKTPPITAQ